MLRNKILAWIRLVKLLNNPNIRHIKLQKSRNTGNIWVEVEEVGDLHDLCTYADTLENVIHKAYTEILIKNKGN